MGPAIKELKFTLKRVRQSPLSLIGLSIVVFFALIGVLAPVLAPPNPSWSTVQFPSPFQIPRDLTTQLANAAEPQPPSDVHPFGTAEYQYDLYYGMIWGTLTAFRVGIWVTFASLAIGLFVGIIAGYYGGVIDEIMMRFTDIILAFPGLILAMALVAALGRSLDNVLLALVLVGWPGYTRLIRGELLRVKQEDYVEAAKAVGCSDLRVILRHALPNSIYPIVISASLDIGTIVLSAAALSFLGLGSPPGFADWGMLISQSQNWIYGSKTSPTAYWHTFLIPGVFIFTFSLGWNLLGDAFRDIMDPTIRRR
jgi:peptide/nickel transport system permease protein